MDLDATSLRKGAPVWVLADDRTGDVAQCLGVAEALNLPFAVKTIEYRRVAAMHNALRGPAPGLVTIRTRSKLQLVPPWPKVVIACGRRTSPVARWIKRCSGALVVQIMDPGLGGRSDIDLFAVPRHDSAVLPRDKVVRILGAPHRVTPERLAEAARLWRPRFETLPRPWLAAIVGGSTRRREFPPALARQLGEQLSRLAGQEGGSVLLTTSRRTGPAAEEALGHAIAQPNFLHFWSAGGDNPFLGLIALADAIVVTGESMSMCSEATMSEAPLYIWSPPGWVVAKHARLHDEFYGAGLARPLHGVERLEPWTHDHLNPAGRIAAAIRERLR